MVVGGEATVDAPLAIVVDEKSASASEVLAGGLRDECRAAIVGERNSYGKGLIQGVFRAERWERAGCYGGGVRDTEGDYHSGHWVGA